MITCAIVDDEPLAVSLLQSYVQRTPVLQLAGTYHNAIEALAGLQREPVDLLFLDIQMPEWNGLDFARVIDTSRTCIIFTTAFSQYASGLRVRFLKRLTSVLKRMFKRLKSLLRAAASLWA